MFEWTGKLHTSCGVLADEKLMMFLRVLTEPTTRSVGDRWQHSETTVCRTVFEVATVVEALLPSYMLPPTSKTPTKIFFCYVLSGWEGSANDSRVLEDTLTKEFPLLDGKYYLADAGCGLTLHTLTPYRGVRVHLKEGATGAERPRTKEELFNLRHAPLRSVIERMFGILKGKFVLLKLMQPHPLEMQARLVLCATVIVNFIRHFEGARALYDCEETREDIDTGESELEDAARDGGADVVQDDLKMVAYRDEIATAMWNAFEAPQ